MEFTSVPSRPRRHRFVGAIGIALVLLAPLVATAAPKTEHVFLITSDGLRWQELFSGADSALLSKEAGGIKDDATIARLRSAYWRETPEARREALMPFFWQVIARQGQLWGNQLKGSVAQVTNGKIFSYPGYNELLTGWADPTIMSNAKVPNRNVTVLEWLHRKPAFAGRVAAYSGWNVMPFIVNSARAGFPAMGGWEPLPLKPRTAREELLNELIAETTPAGNPAEVFDSFVFHAGIEHLRAARPRVMMWSFLETDLWGHQGRYDWVLDSAHRVDNYVRRLWELTQSMPEYAGKTSFVITTDHGRGSAPVEWKSHGVKIKGAENIWMAFLGPDTPALGERADSARVTQSQIAGTIAALLGEDYSAAAPRAAPPITEVLGSRN